MKLAIGIAIGLFYLFISFQAFRQSSAGWDAGYADIGVWWSVIAGFLAIAAMGALVGTWLHTRRSGR